MIIDEGKLKELENYKNATSGEPGFHDKCCRVCAESKNIFRGLHSLLKVFRAAEPLIYEPRTYGPGSKKSSLRAALAEAKELQFEIPPPKLEVIEPPPPV